MKIDLPKISVLLKRISVMIMVGLITATVFSGVFPQPAMADANSDAYGKAMQAAETEYKAWASYAVLQSCINEYHNNDLNKEKYSTSDAFNEAGPDRVYHAGGILDPNDDGKLSCGDADELDQLAKAVGYSGLRELNQDLYPTSGCDGKDACPFVGNSKAINAILAKISSAGYQGLEDNDPKKLSLSGRYWFWTKLYRTDSSKDYGCGGILSNDTAKKAAAPGTRSFGDNNKPNTYWYVDPSTGESIGFKFGITGGDKTNFITDVNLGPDFDRPGKNINQMTCESIAKRLTQDKADALAALVNVKIKDCSDPSKTTCSSGTNPNSTTTTSANGGEDSCESQSGPLGWIQCPVLQLIGGALNWVDTQLSRLLEIDRNKYATGESGDSLYAAWSQFRNIGLTLLIAAMLVMVISTALGVSMFDAYTVKKAFPRMVVSVIFMLLSWYVCLFLIDLSNVVGKGTLGLMTSPFGSNATSLTTLFTATPGGTAIQLGGGIAFGAGAILIPGATTILLSWLGSGLLIMGIAFLALIARQMFIIVLILGSPIAILSWIFPGNDKLWKLWWQTFSKLLLMFPIVMALIASGRIFAGVISNTTGATGEGLLDTLLKFTAYVLPYAFIPFTFKAAGGVFGNLVGMANDRSKGAFDRLRKGRQKNMSEIGQRMGAGQGFRGDQSTRLNRLSSGLASGPKGWVSKDNRAAIRGGKMANLGAAQVKDNALYNAYKNDEKFLLAAANEGMAIKAISDAETELANTNVKDTSKIAALTQEISSRKQALAAARSIPNRTNAFRRQAGLDLAATGYEIAEGQAGWNQLHDMAMAVSGGNEADYASFMNNAQFALKGAGRFDQAGINNGAYYDGEGGLSKASLYELANGKKQSVTAMTASIPDTGPWSPEQAHKAAIAHKELEAMLPNSKGGVRDEIIKQMNKLETRGVKAYSDQASGRTVVDPVTGAATPAMVRDRQSFDNTNTDPAYVADWSSEDRTRGWRTYERQETMGDIAQREARAYERPDPNKL